MSSELTLVEITLALGVKDPLLPQLIQQLSQQKLYSSNKNIPVRDGALTLNDYLNLRNSWNFSDLTDDEKKAKRTQLMAQIESDTAEIPLPEPLKLHQVIWSLWQTNDAYSRNVLLRVIASVKLTYGPWRALKKIFKAAETSKDWEIYGALTARFDMEYAERLHRDDFHASVRTATFSYLCRRAWRTLRNLGELAYPDAACQCLVHYSNNARWKHTWVYNHILYHKSGDYDRSQFNPYRNKGLDDWFRLRLYAEAWQRSARPFFTLLEHAQADSVKKLALMTLQKEFRSQLREVDAEWVARLNSHKSSITDELIVWLFENVSTFEQAKFKQLGLHQTVLGLLDSKSSLAQEYAAQYIRVYARDLPFKQLLEMVDSNNQKVSQVAIDLINERDPINDIGLDAWGELLETKNGYALAKEKLLKHFGAQALSLDWLSARLLKPATNGFSFASEFIAKFYSKKNISSDFYCQLLMKYQYQDTAQHCKKFSEFAFEQLTKFDLAALSNEFLMQALVNPYLNLHIFELVKQGKLQPSRWSVDFLKSYVFQPHWQHWSWLIELKTQANWAQNLSFSERSASVVLTWLADVRLFTLADLGITWLFSMLETSQSIYHNFASDYMLRTLSPADFSQMCNDDAHEINADAVMAGCEQLWQILLQTDKISEPKSRFAMAYIRRHHADICLQETDRPVDPNCEIPADFLTFERIKPLLMDKNAGLRQFALDICRWEMARWQVKLNALIELCESPYLPVREFITHALTVDDSPEHRRYRIDPALLTANAVYSFCDSNDRATRMLGMTLILKHPRLQQPEQLFCLTESPDNQIRAFVLNRFWHWYCDKGVTDLWQPAEGNKLRGERAQSLSASLQPENIATQTYPAKWQQLSQLLRRALFEIPSGRQQPNKESDEIRRKLKPLPTRKAKLQLVETFRDIAVENLEFAEVILPLLTEFMNSKGPSERAACLVAVTRIQHALSA